MAHVACQQCGGEMKKTVTSSRNCLGILVALIMFFGGLFITIFFFWTIIAPIIGVLMMIAALFMGGKRQKVWKCGQCGYVLNRA